MQHTDEELSEVLRAEHARLVSADEPMLDCQITRWPQALPHYTVSLEQALVKLPSLPLSLHLVGNYLGQIGLTKILARAQRVAERVKIQA